MLRHWLPLTLFLREPGAPIDNNLVTAANGSDQVMPTPGLCRVGRLVPIPSSFSLLMNAA
jgi:hypothetical protein